MGLYPCEPSPGPSLGRWMEHPKQELRVEPWECPPSREAAPDEDDEECAEQLVLYTALGVQNLSASALGWRWLPTDHPGKAKIPGQGRAGSVGTLQLLTPTGCSALPFP